MSVGVVNKQTGDRIPTAGMPAIDNALDLTSANPVQNAIITAALANKQDKTDNNLQTTDKTVVGAVNELKRGLNNLMRSETVTISKGMQPNDGATISISNVASTPKIVQIVEPAGGKPLVASNWWVSSGTLLIQIINLSTTGYPGGDIVVNFLG